MSIFVSQTLNAVWLGFFFGLFFFCYGESDTENDGIAKDALEII